METETDKSLETRKKDAFRSITSDSDSESILTKEWLCRNSILKQHVPNSFRHLSPSVSEAGSESDSILVNVILMNN